jgi:hypothetical protein
MSCMVGLTSKYSFKWVESPEHGKGGPDWVEVRLRFGLRLHPLTVTTRTTLKLWSLSREHISCVPAQSSEGAPGSLQIRESYVSVKSVNMFGVTHKAVKSKAMTAYLSGEMRDTVQLNPAGAYGTYNIFV